MRFLLRRIVAFSIDLAPFASLWMFLAVLALVGLFDGPVWMDRLIYVAFFSYLGLAEWLSAGQSLGKKLTRIVITMRDGGEVPGQKLLSRSLLNAALMPATFMISSVASAGFPLSKLGALVASSSLSIPILVQMSFLIVTRGQTGLADLFFGTIARSSLSAPYLQPRMDLKRATLVAVSAGFILASFIALGVARASDYVKYRARGLDKEEYMNLAPAEGLMARLSFLLGPEGQPPRSIAVEPIRPCDASDHGSSKSPIPYLFLPVEELPLSFADCLVVHVSPESSQMGSATFYLALGAAIDSMLREEDGPLGRQPRPVLVRVVVTRRALGGFVHFGFERILMGHFLPTANRVMVLFDERFTVVTGPAFVAKE